MCKPTTKLGYQPKYTSPKGGYWYKEDFKGGEALAEVLVSYGVWQKFSSKYELILKKIKEVHRVR